MKSPRIVVLSLALLGVFAGPVAAATVDYDLSIPLIADDPVDLTAPTATLRGTLSYDDETSTGSGTFTIVGSTDASANIGLGMSGEFFSGFSFVLPLDSDVTGLLFDGFADSGDELYFNVAAGSSADANNTGQVNFCEADGCTWLNTIGATVTSPNGGQADPPGGGVSAVPLPPAVSLFGGALLALASLASGRRSPRLPSRVLARR